MYLGTVPVRACTISKPQFEAGKASLSSPGAGFLNHSCPWTKASGNEVAGDRR